MRALFLLLALAFAVPAAAQDSYSTLTPPASTADVQAMQALIPTPATSNPAGPVDNNSGAVGTAGQYAPSNHTHPSKARKGRVLVPVGGFVDVAFATAFTTGAPLCVVVAETTAGDTNVVNAQIDGATTMSGFRIRITRTAVTNASLLGLSILSVPTQVATYAHYVCLEP